MIYEMARTFDIAANDRSWKIKFTLYILNMDILFFFSIAEIFVANLELRKHKNTVK